MLSALQGSNNVQSLKRALAFRLTLVMVWVNSQYQRDVRREHTRCIILGQSAMRWVME